MEHTVDLLVSMVMTGEKAYDCDVKGGISDAVLKNHMWFIAGLPTRRNIKRQTIYLQPAKRQTIYSQQEGKIFIYNSTSTSQ